MLPFVVPALLLAFTVVKLAGAAYLVHLGIRAIRDRGGFAGGVALSGTAPSRLLALRQGFVVGVSNPKTFMIFGAVLPQFVDRSAGQVPAQLLVLGTVAVLIALVSDSIWAVLASQVRAWLGAAPWRGRTLGVTGGVSLIGLGAALAVSGRPE